MNPLKKYLCISLDDKIEVWGLLHYERIVTIYYNYGCMGHLIDACPFPEVPYTKEDIPYDEWILALEDQSKLIWHSRS